MRKEGAADDLFDEVVVDVYAGAEFGHFFVLVVLFCLVVVVGLVGCCAVGMS